MARKAKFPPSMLPHKASGQMRTRFAGKDYYLGPIGSEQAKQEYAALLVRLAASNYEITEKSNSTASQWPTIAVACARWIEHATPDLSPDELGQHRHALRPLLELHSRCTTDTFGPDELDDVRRRMRDYGWCRNTVNARASKIKAVWRWLERKKLAPAGSWAHLQTLEHLPPMSRGYRDSVPVEPAEWPTVVAVCERMPRTARAILLLQWFTGGRNTEMRVMRLSEIDRSADEWVYRPEKHKNSRFGHLREIALGPKAREVLEPWLVGLARDAYVFPGSRHGSCYSEGAYAAAVQRAVEKAGVVFHAYQCRHSAKDRVDRELGEEFARAVLGHTTPITTRGYAKNSARRHDLELARQAARKLG
jgi:integrase